MAVRKSKQIGKIINGYLVLDSRRKNKDTELKLKCEQCGEEFWKSRGFLKNKGLCPNCQNGRNYRNANGYVKEKLYQRYRNILRRVKEKNRYQGIDICKEWEDDYLNFRDWALKNGYDDSLTIDRIDNSKGYEPSNCRWVSLKKQANNRRNNHIVEYNGKNYTISEFSEFIGLPYNTVLQRIKKNWDLDDVVNTPYKSRKKWSEMDGRIKD